MVGRGKKSVVSARQELEVVHEQRRQRAAKADAEQDMQDGVKLLQAQQVSHRRHARRRWHTRRRRRHARRADEACWVIASDRF